MGIGSGMLRQALPSLKTSKPRVASVFYELTRTDSCQNLRSRWSGQIICVSSIRILIYCNIHQGARVFHYSSKLYKEKKKRSFNNIFFRFLSLKNKKYSCCIEYRLRGSFGVNQSIIRWQTAFVQEGNWVKAGDLLADINSSFQGSMAVGQNKLVCYIPFDGLNFEDAIVANESIKTIDSFHTVHQEAFVYMQDLTE